ncbi:carbon-monoxide dehydrogenase small subunit [Paraburkholderia atlantica]|uniref:Carbon-monoxide dehydrogenase small subunit n=1 Tax=Paraburkholderia atlantica TaxID=2654982 RepID=A0A7W8Q6D6_PARAM|nr:(2Fe-2S)-binding protein [Paraburkholderia atlantica]MBB5424139.1 carbon-monoxide dehydrogenase small subunit [Paraburkholderia atlantica]NUY31066.1 (2Fe-2S)-binding protein [Paraburkholderia atlantica]
MAEVQLRVNGVDVRREVPDQTLLVEFIRETLRLTGTHVGCDTSQCGACTVNLDGVSVKSCTVLAAQASGGVVRTVEGLSENTDAPLHPVQSAFVQCHGLQCGFCTPGMIMSVDFYLRKQPDLDEASICHALEGNICRCTGYVNIIEAVRHAAHEMYPALAGKTAEGAQS